MSLPLPDPYVVSPDGTADAPGVQRNFEALAKAGVDTGGRSLKIRAGSTTITFTAAVQSAAATINHGLGGSPIALSALPDELGVGISMGTGFVGATSFQVKGTFVDGIARTQNNTVYWIAIG